MRQLCFLGKFSLLMLKNEKQILTHTNKKKQQRESQDKAVFVLWRDTTVLN